MRLQVGQTLYGYCGGWFGRDSYVNKRVEAVGADWIVARDDEGNLHFSSGADIHAALTEFTTTSDEEA